MVTERTIINALIIAATCILAPYLISETLTVGYIPLMVVVGATTLIGCFFFLKERLCMCPLLASGWVGTVNFLPLGLRPLHVLCLLLILYYFTAYVLIRQKRIKLGMPQFFWPIFVLTAIMLVHNHEFAVHVLGGGEEGGKPAILAYITVLAYFCGINIPSPSVNFIRKIPLFYLVISSLSCAPFLLTTVIPGLAPYLYFLTDSVNKDAYFASVSNSDSGFDLSRVGVYGSIGFCLQIYLLSYYPIGTWLRPERWWIIALSLLCLMLEVLSGYRNSLFGFLVLTMVGAWCYYSWRAIFFPIMLMLVLIAAVTLANNDVIHLPLKHLPLIAQRTLSFLPGDWDDEAISTSKSSNDFRESIQEVYLSEDALKSPLFGNGFSFDSQEFANWIDVMNGGGGMEDRRYAQAKAFVVGKEFHTGWISVYDAVGIVGSSAFVILVWNQIRFLARFISGPKRNRQSSLFPLYVWMQCNIVTTIVTYFTVFGDFGPGLSTFLVYSVVLSHLSDLEKKAEIAIVLPEEKKSVEFSGVGRGRYGYGTGY